jgi:pimeloyl-ACP methyl ester carboxylesterase
METPMNNPIAPTNGLEPFFFGPAERQLYGCYHQPAEPARDCGVLICYPIWQEYSRSHRACFNLAQSLAKAGFPVLRFDYFGTGDSAGDTHQLDLQDWQASILAAIDELQDRSGVDIISLVGLRLGASLAATVASQRRDIGSLVLWEPVVHGPQYLEDAIFRHQNILEVHSSQLHREPIGQRPTELLGSPVSAAMLDGLEALDLLAIERRLARKVLVIESHTGESASKLAEHLQQFAAGRVDYRYIEDIRFWVEYSDKGLVPERMLEAMVLWLSEVHA